MAKKVTAFIKLQIPAGAANPAPPVGPALGAAQVNIMQFCQAFNAATSDKQGDIIPVEITVYEDRTFDFIDQVLSEIIRLFPSQYIHVGGDECPKTQWKQCALCQQRIRDNHLEADGKHSAEERLQSYTIRHVAQFLKQHGRRMIGWDEILEGGLPPEATVMSWRGEAGGIEAARQGHDVIMTPNTYLYFDYYQSQDTANEPEAIGGYVPLEKVYGYEPLPAGLSAEEQKHIVGVQANCWTEYMKTYRQVEYMELPRMAALCEVQWCNPEQKDFDDFVQGRLQRLAGLYRLKGYNYRPGF